MLEGPAPVINEARASRQRPCAVVAVLTLVLFLHACATVRELSALRNVDFALAGVSGATLAGVPIDTVRGIEDLSAMQVAAVAAGFARGQLPVETNLLVRASNPENNVQARLVELDWTLFLDGQEMISGVLDQDFVLPPGQPVNVPVRIQLNLLDVFDGQLEQMVNLATALAGTGDPRRLRLEARPSVQTPLGPIRYPGRIPIEYEVGRL